MKTQFQRIARLSLLVLLLGPSGRAQAADTATASFVIRHARVFDGERVRTDTDVWVDRSVIRAIGRHLPARANVAVIDGAGKTLLPGLIDSHVHTMGSRDFLRSALALGVTTECDMGAAPQFAFQIEREQAAGGDTDLCDLRSSGTQPTAPDGHGTEYGHPVPTLSSPAEAQAFVDARIAEGSDFIGEIIYDDGSEYGLQLPTLSKATLRAVIVAAHRRGKLAVVHALSLQAAKDALAAGADGLVHLFADRAPDDAFVALAVRHHAFVIPTLSLLASLAGQPSGPAQARDPHFEPFLGPAAIADLETKLPRSAGDLAYANAAVRRLAARGVPILAGTDAHNPGTAHGASLHGELALLVAAGLTPLEALRSATSANAAAFRHRDRGRIAPGQRADLLLVDGDPTTRISDLAAIAMVWKRGLAVDRAACRAACDAAKERATIARHAPPPARSESGSVSDFDDGSTRSTFGLGWRASTGRLLGGHEPTARIAVVDSGASGSAGALEVTGEIPRGVFGWAGALYFPGEAPMAPVNLSGKHAISFAVQGDGGRYVALLFSRRKGAQPALVPFVAPAHWDRVVLPLAAFDTDGADIEGLLIGALATPGPFRFELDDVRFQ